MWRFAGLPRLVAPLLFLVPGAGCQGWYFLTNPEQKQAVAAEYREIGAKKLAVVIWAEQATLDMHALARHDVAEAVKYHMQANLRNARFVDPAEVSRFQERSGLDWEGMSPEELCRKFDCDLILRIDLLEYTTRAHDARELRKGRIKGSLSLYGRQQPRTADPLYVGEAQATYPNDSRGVLDMSDRDILRATLDQFGLAVARKFYDHEVSYTKTGNRQDRR